MTVSFAAAFAAATTSAYTNLSYITRHAPADIWSQLAKLSSMAMAASAPSASSSKLVLYAVALIGPDRAVNCGCKSKKSSIACQGDTGMGGGSSSEFWNRCSQYQSQISRNSKIISDWLCQLGVQLLGSALTLLSSAKIPHILCGTTCACAGVVS